jgi:predicted nucleotidyltransferase
VGIEEPEGFADDNLIDICKPKDISKVLYTMRPLQFFQWAHDLGYQVEIDDYCEITLKDHRGKPEFFAWLQHKDFFLEMDRSNSDVRWM